MACVTTHRMQAIYATVGKGTHISCTHIKAGLGPDFLLEEDIWNPELHHPVHGLFVFEALLEAYVPIIACALRALSNRDRIAASLLQTRHNDDDISYHINILVCYGLFCVWDL
jgi:hypothetical protein